MSPRYYTSAPEPDRARGHASGLVNVSVLWKIFRDVYLPVLLRASLYLVLNLVSRVGARRRRPRPARRELALAAAPLALRRV
jgi:hypothetical protein